MWGEQSKAFVVERVPCKTIFIDAQIQLMKSFVKEDESSWREFIHCTFMVPIADFHQRYNTVIVCFDNYQYVLIFKSIEQSKRVAGSASTDTFQFKAGDALPDMPHAQKIWVQALQNRSFKSNIISLIASRMAAEYVPPRRAMTLVIDFVNATRIDFHTQGATHAILENMKPTGESDVKFMRYVPLFGNMCVDSIDSDVLLIAALYVSRNSYRGNLYVRRYKIRLLPLKCDKGDKKRKIGEDAEPAPAEKKCLEYNIIHINLLMQVLHTCMTLASAQNANELPTPTAPSHLTAMLSFMVLLCGCDYSKKLPRICVKSLWDNFEVVVLAMLACTSYSNNLFSVNAQQSIDGLIASLYTRIYTKHVGISTSSPHNTMQTVLTRLHASTLSEKTKLELPTHLSLRTTLRNIEWAINYWSIENGDPACPIDGTHGFQLVNNKVVFTQHNTHTPPPSQITQECQDALVP